MITMIMRLMIMIIIIENITSSLHYQLHHRHPHPPTLPPAPLMFPLELIYKLFKFFRKFRFLFLHIFVRSVRRHYLILFLVYIERPIAQAARCQRTLRGPHEFYYNCRFTHFFRRRNRNDLT